MRRLAIMGAVVFAAALSFPVSASGPQPLTIARDWTQHQDPVEQESPDWRYASNAYNLWRCTHDEDGTEHADTCIHNPTDCSWDVDDSTADDGYGFLGAGVTVGDSMCVVADGYDNFGGDDKWIEARVFAPARTLAVTFAGQSVVPVVSGTGYEWLACVHEHATVFDVIPDSNGGTGVVLTFDLSVAALRKTNGVTVQFQTWGNYPFYATHCA